ncbi:MAG TPA: response regulator [Bryobacteraceae bacterium]|nr:response regulator [Bryobacteraceae bacterium]
MEPGRILIVDDDAALLRLMRTYLSRLGYAVDTCQGGAEAWALVEARPAAHAVVVVDANMPGMCGEELGRRILDRDPAVRLVLMSGYPADLSVSPNLDARRVGFLHKPFVPRELADVVRARPKSGLNGL